MYDCSDLVPTVAVLGAFASGKTRISNVENIRVKESDRIAAVTAELRRIGARVKEFKTGSRSKGETRSTARRSRRTTITASPWPSTRRLEGEGYQDRGSQLCRGRHTRGFSKSS